MPSEEKRLAAAKPTHGRLLASLSAPSEIPDNVDWHKEGKVLLPQDQSSCGSCWAFTTAATMESLISIKNNAEPDRLSVQYLVDCDNTNYGCGGGWMLDAYQFVHTHGLIKDGDYQKYNARKQGCSEPKDSSIKRVYNKDQNEEDNISVERLKQLVSQQPIGVAMHSNPKCLMPYKSGILRESDCKCSDSMKVEVNHAVTVVGYGINEDASTKDECPGFWKIKNSWGPEWGDQGFFKLCIPKDGHNLSTGTCQVLSYV